jgi:hypothetical protein
MRSGVRSAELFPIVRINIYLMENAAQRADRDVTLLRDNSRVDCFPRASYELDVTILLAGPPRTQPTQAGA